MKKLLKKAIFLSILVGLFWGCSSVSPSPVPQKSLFVVWKSPSLKYADQGFLYMKPKKLKLEVYASGQPALNISILPSQICTGPLCMSKKSFNAKYLSKYYPENTLESILTAKPIFGGKNLKKSSNGFIQKIKSSHYNITYKVTDSSVEFIDRASNIIIKIKNQG
jgi:hypothetical protein